MGLLLALVACSPDLESLPPRGDCNPVDPAACLLPFPSTFFHDGDQVSFGPTSLPEHWIGGHLTPDLYNERDGFPILGGAYTDLGAVSVEGLVHFTDIGAYAEPDARTLWIDAETGERLPHWVELVEGPDQPDDRMLVLRPAVPMERGRRYVIGLRDVAGTDGRVLPPPEGFRTLRDAAETSDPDLKRQQAHYDDVVFPTLEAAGAPRDTLQMAWDLVTSTEAGTQRRLRHLQDEAEAWADEGRLSVRIDSVHEGDCTDGSVHVAKLLKGFATVPLFLEDPAPTSASLLTRDEAGLPFAVGEREVPFTVVVPCSVLESAEPAPVFQFAHGLFHSEVALEEDFVGEMADRHEVVFYGQRMTGMSADELPVISLELASDLDGFHFIPERLHQGHLEQLLAPRIITDVLADQPELIRSDDSRMLSDDVTLYATSQGAILGGATLVLSDDLPRAVFNVPAMPMSLVLPRATLFSPFRLLLENALDTPHDAELMVPVMGMLFEPVESAGYAHELGSESMLLQAAIGDASVTTLGAHVFARVAGAGLVVPENRAVWGLDPLTVPAAANAFIEVDYGHPEPMEALPAEEGGDPHGLPIRDPLIQDQAAIYLTTGTVMQTCDGACDPE